MRLDERGKQCPGPVIDTKKASEPCNPGEMVEVLTGNEIAVQDLNKMTASKDLLVVSEEINNNKFSVKITVGQGVTPASGVADDSGKEPAAYQPNNRKKGMTMVLSPNLMGHSDPELGKALMKGFAYALTQQDALSETILLHDSGAYFSYEGSDNLEGLRSLESQEVETPACRICLDFYGLSEELQVGNITNMYEIVERMTASKLLVRP